MGMIAPTITSKMICGLVTVSENCRFQNPSRFDAPWLFNDHHSNDFQQMSAVIKITGYFAGWHTGHPLRKLV
jgi:hypothetical protein